MDTKEHLSKDWKLLITCGNPKIVHARGCEFIKDWSAEGSEELTKLKPQKHNICKICEGLAYATIGAKDYADNVSKYKQIFTGVKADILKELYVNSRAKTQISGNKLYLAVKSDRWYIDFSYDEICLFHNNYKVSRRERKDTDFSAVGYHEHSIKGKTGRMQTALQSIIDYCYEEAEKVHKEKRKKKPKILLSEYDPEAYGFSDI